MVGVVIALHIALLVFCCDRRLAAAIIQRSRPGRVYRPAEYFEVTAPRWAPDRPLEVEAITAHDAVRSGRALIHKTRRVLLAT